ncbi:hypothetical protein [Bacillus subtilis]|uniref:hypothetical protein n=1 Tax=Bacillus subtilis TaxID=1423 RepID=UPI003F84D16A
MGVDSDGDAKIKDDMGTIDSHFRRNYALFRKAAAATNPSVEERVAKAEGEIESLKSDVAALKGEAEYKRIGKSEAQAGDYVKFIETDDSSLTVGKMYVIKEIDYDGDPLITDDDDDENWAGTGEEFEIYRKVNAASVEAEPKPERLKVGDYAKVVGNSNSFSETGSIVKITVDDGSECPFKITFLNGEYAGWHREESLVRATDEEVAEAKRAAKWAEIGREVGEYKVGDVVRYDHGDNEICEVVDDTEDGRVGVQTKDYGICREKPDTLRLITPVEARFDR